MKKLLAWCQDDKRFLYLVAIITSIALSFWIGYRDVVVNPDGICYLLSAQMFETAGIKDVMKLCPQSQWPFYSALIYGLTQLTSLSYLVSANLLNGLFSMLSVVMFTMIVSELGGSRRVLWLAVLVILFAHQFNNLRESIIRDHGFWAFYLSSIYFLLNYFHKPRWITALAFSVSLFIATIFRIEGAIFLLLMPFVSWFYFDYSWRERTKFFITLSLPLWLVGIALVAWKVGYSHQSISQLGRVGEIANQFQNGFNLVMSRYQTSKAALAHYVLPLEAESDASAVALLVWITWYLYNLCITLSYGYAALVLYAWFCKASLLPRRAIPVVVGYLLVNVVITLGFLAEHAFISKRYLIALTLLLMLWIPFAGDNLIKQWSSFKHRVFLCVVSLIICASSIGGIIEFGHSKLYIRTAGDWVSRNIPTEAKLYANDFQLMYYSQHFGNQIFTLLPSYISPGAIADGRWKQYDYLALRLKNKQEGDLAAVVAELGNAKPMQVFKNKRGNYVAIYKINREERSE